MHISFNRKFDKRVVSIHPGEDHATAEDEVISTVLGSCIAVILLDKRNLLSGMNHFMLPESKRAEDFENSKYGINAMELLINDMIKKGGIKKNFVAKVFGGGHVLRATVASDDIPEKNIAFTFDFLKTERIPVESKDTGGDFGRKVLLFASSGRVFVNIVKSLNEWIFWSF